MNSVSSSSSDTSFRSQAAAMALQGILAGQCLDADIAVIRALEVTDKLIEALRKPPEGPKRPKGLL
jgi:hypothetical protein